MESELPGPADSYVLWTDLPEIVKGEGGRYVHFGWQTTEDGVVYVVHDLIAGRVSYPSHANVHIVDYDVNPIDLTANAIWRGAKHRIPAVQARGLGESDLGSITETGPDGKGTERFDQRSSGPNPYCQAP